MSAPATSNSAATETNASALVGPTNGVGLPRKPSGPYVNTMSRPYRSPSVNA